MTMIVIMDFGETQVLCLMCKKIGVGEDCVLEQFIFLFSQEDAAALERAEIVCV